jgi:hypothetical protein
MPETKPKPKAETSPIHTCSTGTAHEVCPACLWEKDNDTTYRCKHCVAQGLREPALH